MWRQWILTLVMLLCMVGVSFAKDWNITVMGINVDDFKGRDWKVIVVGAVASLAVHELGHLAIGEMNGDAYMTGLTTVRWDQYHRHSHGTQQLFNRAGFLSQLLVGSALTAIPATRHSDFALGFNGFTTGNTAIYTIGGGHNPETSDIGKLDHGELEGSLYTLGAGVLTYINLNKE